MATIYLVACASKKRTKPGPAEQLYDSALFNKSAQLAQLKADRWHILSAKHGLVSPSQVIEPYNKTLNEMPKSKRLQWAEAVLGDLLRQSKPDDTVVFLAGAKYREHIVPQLRRRGYSVNVPMEGMRIGEQLSWLNRRIAEAQLEKRSSID